MGKWEAGDKKPDPSKPSNNTYDWLSRELSSSFAWLPSGKHRPLSQSVSSTLKWWNWSIGSWRSLWALNCLIFFFYQSNHELWKGGTSSKICQKKMENFLWTDWACFKESEGCLETCLTMGKALSSSQVSASIRSLCHHQYKHNNSTVSPQCTDCFIRSWEGLSETVQQWWDCPWRIGPARHEPHRIPHLWVKSAHACLVPLLLWASVSTCLHWRVTLPSLGYERTKQNHISDVCLLQWQVLKKKMELLGTPCYFFLNRKYIQGAMQGDCMYAEGRQNMLQAAFALLSNAKSGPESSCPFCRQGN